MGKIDYILILGTSMVHILKMACFDSLYGLLIGVWLRCRVYGVARSSERFGPRRPFIVNLSPSGRPDGLKVYRRVRYTGLRLACSRFTIKRVNRRSLLFGNRDEDGDFGCLLLPVNSRMERPQQSVCIRQ